MEAVKLELQNILMKNVLRVCSVEAWREDKVYSRQMGPKSQTQLRRDRREISRTLCGTRQHAKSRDGFSQNDGISAKRGVTETDLSSDNTEELDRESTGCLRHLPELISRVGHQVVPHTPTSATRVSRIRATREEKTLRTLSVRPPVNRSQNKPRHTRH